MRGDPLAVFIERFGRRRVDPEGITVYLIERLGNQLFAYSAALALARRLGVPCYANLAFFHHSRPKREYDKTYALDGFESGLRIPSDPRYHRPIMLGQPSRKYCQVWYRYLSRSPIFLERSTRYDPRIEGVDAGATLLGLFQSWRYFDQIRGELQQRIATLKNPSAWYTSVARELRPGSGAIALNVRRGDYMLPRQLTRQGLVGSGYYFEAVRVMRQMGLDGPVYVASDSLDIALEELQLVENVVPLDPPTGIDPLEVMVLLSRADGLAIANSTFSWWAAYIGERRGQVVIAPRPWFVGGDLDSRDLFPYSWLTLDRDMIPSQDA